MFYVTDLTGKKVVSEPRQETIRKRLEAGARRQRKVGARPGAGLARHHQLDAPVELVEVFLAEVAAHDAGIRLRLALGHQFRARPLKPPSRRKRATVCKRCGGQVHVERIGAALIRMPGERDLGEALDLQIFEQQARGLAAVTGQRSPR